MDKNSDHLDLQFEVKFVKVAKSTTSKFFTKAEWKKINWDLYQAKCDEVLQKIEVLYHLLKHGSSDTLALDLYCCEIVHAMKVAQSAASPQAQICVGTCKLGWNKDPNVNDVKFQSVLV